MGDSGDGNVLAGWLYGLVLLRRRRGSRSDARSRVTTLDLNYTRVYRGQIWLKGSLIHRKRHKVRWIIGSKV